MVCIRHTLYMMHFVCNHLYRNWCVLYTQYTFSGKPPPKKPVYRVHFTVYKKKIVCTCEAYCVYHVCTAQCTTVYNSVYDWTIFCVQSTQKFQALYTELSGLLCTVHRNKAFLYS